MEFKMPLSRALVAATGLLFAGSGASAAGELRIYSWSDYFGAKAVETFSAETGTKVFYDVFDSNDIVETKLLAGKSGYDLVTPNVAPHFDRQLKAGVWGPLDKSKLKNLGNADPAILSQIAKIDPGNTHSVPWMWGTTGIILNTEKIKAIMPDAPLDSWRMLFDPGIVSKFQKCGVVMLDDGEQVLGSALIYLGKSINTATQADLDEAVALVKKVRPFIRKFHSSEY
jgi:putrescine transport system substrate-binding protein